MRREFGRVVFALALAAVAAGCAKKPKSTAAPIEGTVIAEDGVRIAYDMRGQGDTALVFIHGWCCNRQFWKNQLDEFAAEHQVVALDLPGHGASGAARTDWSIAGLGGDVRTVVESLGLPRVVLVAHSLGGPVALEAARLLPGRVVGVIAVDTLHDVDFVLPRESVEEMAKRFEQDFTGTMTQAVRSMFPPTADPEVVEWTTTASMGANQAAAVSLMRDYVNFRPKEALSAAGVPVRCINVAPRDEAGGLPTTVEKNRQYADYDAVILENVGHFPMLERPEEFNAKLRAVLAELLRT